MRIRSRIWQNWWMQGLVGLLIAAVAVLPWLWIGPEDAAIMPYSSDDGLGLTVVFALSTLVSGYVARRQGRRATGFALMVDVGLILGLGLLALQALAAFEPGLFGGEFSAAAIRHLWVLGSVFVVSQILYFLLVKLPLAGAAIVTAMLSVAVSYWLQTVASVLVGAQTYTLYLAYAGPLILGLVLGALGFLRALWLLVWLVCLLIQWAMPAVFEGAAAVVESGVTGILGLPQAFADHAGEILLNQAWQTPVVVTLATAMLTSVLLLIVRKIRLRHR